MGSVKRIVICGGGVIGAAIAYFSSRRGARPIVIERHEVAGAASGKSGALSRNGGRGAPSRHRRGPDVRPERSRARCLRIRAIPCRKPGLPSACRNVATASPARS
jgi:glycine/D-amino acid oxidase-like deaminating enzyme